MSRYGSIPWEEGKALEKLIRMSFVYLINNFHKLKPDKKLYVAIKIAERRIPTDVKYSGIVEIDLNILSEHVLNPDGRKENRLN